MIETTLSTDKLQITHHSQRSFYREKCVQIEMLLVHVAPSCPRRSYPLNFFKLLVRVGKVSQFLTLLIVRKRPFVKCLSTLRRLCRFSDQVFILLGSGESTQKIELVLVPEESLEIRCSLHRRSHKRRSNITIIDYHSTHKDVPLPMGQGFLHSIHIFVSGNTHPVQKINITSLWVLSAHN